MRLLTLLTAALLAACSGPEPQPAPRQTVTPSASPSPSPSPTPSADLGSVRLRLEPVAEGLAAPLFLTTADDSGSRYVVEQGGTIRVLQADGRLRTEPFLDISDRITAGGEQGLLGLAFHPEDPTRFFVNYTDTGGDTVIAEYTAASPSRARRGSERVLLRIDQPYSNHNGGMVAFGPDGHLFVATGDGGSGGDPHGNGQRLDTHLGKILRLNVSTPGRAAAPGDNPFAGGQGKDEIFHTGLRNPWRFSFDRETGDMWIGDVGQNSVEEIDLAPAGRAGLNFGWNLREGRSCYTQGACDTDGLTDPIDQYPTSEGCAVTGGYVYRGQEHPDLRGVYLYADYCGGQIWGLLAEEARDGRARSRKLIETGIAISSFGEDASGELYVTDLHGGGVYRVVAE
ncbi:MAG TPA: PQQ-dependent sugar dehydrogenase [Actinomycetota bacterium]|nr:PQQ-dependent sugar dehydrogenase [Actinomycetota bacterium]